MLTRALLIALLWLVSQPLLAAGRLDTTLLRRIYDYPHRFDSIEQIAQTSYTYRRFHLSVDRKNPTLLLVPSVYAVAYRGQRQYIGETYERVWLHQDGTITSQPLLRLTTVPHRRRTFGTLNKYLTPEIYNETMVENNLLSPFHPSNRRWYRYRAHPSGEGRTLLVFKARRRNTQLVTGDAIVEDSTGRVLSCKFHGEYDMVNFWITAEMDSGGRKSLMAKHCEVRTRFRFLRSKVSSILTAYYNLPPVLTDTIVRPDNYEQMCQVRPDTLGEAAQALYDAILKKRQEYDSLQASGNLQMVKTRPWASKLLESIGDGMVNRIKTRFGMYNEGYVRINPILNPLYMGYDHRRGFTYKFDVRASYQLGSNSELSTRLKSGYAFKQRQFYYRIPFFYYYNKPRNHYLKLQFSNGNHIRSRSIQDAILDESNSDSGTGIPGFEDINEFKRTDSRLVLNHNFNDWWGFQVGALYLQHTAVDRKALEALGWKSQYQSFAPVFQLQLRPWGWQGPMFFIDYDRSIKGILKSNTGYERIEIDGSYVHNIHRLQSFHFRAGVGFYTWKDRHAYFLDYENFRDENLPGGWGDEWNGSFELLRSSTYNYSDYYVRANVSYESPLLLLSWLPVLGHYMESERIYASVLYAETLHPYIELGYGFTNRIFSCGVFVSNGQGNRSIGCKFGFELFRHW